MRIGIDARLYNESGVGRYIRNFLFHLQRLDQKNEYYIFLLKKDYDNLGLSKNFQKVEADFGWYGFSEQIKFPKLLKQHNLDIIHFPHFNVPVFCHGRFIVTIHDLIHQRFQMRRATTHGPLIYQLKKIGYNKVFNHAISKSQKIITVSDYVKSELIKEWKIKEEKIAVTKEAVEENILKIDKNITEKDIEQILNKFSIEPPLIFYLGNAHPHKNIDNLIKTFIKLKTKYTDLKLVLSGPDHYFWQRIKKDFQQKDIIYTGYLSEIELIVLYKSAKVYVIPSLEEGFGIPMLEAFALGCPVAASKVASLPEVGGDAAVYFNPKNIDDMVEKITIVLDNGKLRKQLIEKGMKRYKEFSLQTLARQTLQIYRETATLFLK